MAKSKLSRLRRYKLKRSAKAQLKAQRKLKRRFIDTRINPYTGILVDDCTWTVAQVLKRLNARILKALRIVEEARESNGSKKR